MFCDERGRRLTEESGWKEVVIRGLDTESCVLKTAVNAFELGYTPLVVEDLCASHAGREAHEAGIFVASRFIGKKQIIRTGQLRAGMSS